MEIAGNALYALETSLQSEREWKNIQQTVVNAIQRLVVLGSSQQKQFQAFNDRLMALEATQNDQLKAVEQQLETMRSAITSEFQHILRGSEGKMREHVFADVETRVAGQREELKCVWMDQVEKINRQWHNELETMRTQLLDDTKALLTKEIKEIGTAVLRVDETKLDALDCKLQRLEKQLRTVESNFTTQWSRSREEFVQAIDTKACLSDITKLFDAQSNAIDTLREDIETSTTACEQRTETQQTINEELKRHMHELVGIVEALQSDQVVLKTLTIDHVQNGASDQQTTDTKRTMLKLHDTVKSIRRNIESVAKRADVEALNEQVAWIRKQLRSEIYQARYIWKEGSPTAKQTIPWTSQVVNTSTEVFLWQQSHRDAVTTVVPGLYHLQAAFFTRLEPVLQVLVNGEPALIITSQNAGRLDENIPPSIHNINATLCRDCDTRRRRLHHSAGDLVGLEICGFLALPAHAVITISYDITERAQGFLNLRKL